jgi:hypothetical protein
VEGIGLSQRPPLGFTYYGGVPIDSTMVASEFFLISSHKQLAGIFSISGYWGCSGEFKDIVEELEPGVHQFFPVRTITRLRSEKPITRLRDGGPVDDQYFILNCLQLVDAIVPEKSSGPTFRMAVAGGREPTFFTARDHVCLSKDRIAGKHLWRGKTEALYDGYYLVSNELMARIKAAKLKGYDYGMELSEA